jgi:hypothetical protein
MRWRKGIRDLNPLVAHGVKKYGIIGGQAALLALNLVLVILLAPFLIPLAVLFGAKLGLASLQIRSFVE